MKWSYTLDGENQQDYVFDLRSKADYDKGHIVGSINVEFDPKDAESFIERIPSDWSVYIIGDDDAEAKVMRDSLKAIDEHLYIYVITSAAFGKMTNKALKYIGKMSFIFQNLLHK